jgi:hypothetical protein
MSSNATASAAGADGWDGVAFGVFVGIASIIAVTAAMFGLRHRLIKRGGTCFDRHLRSAPPSADFSPFDDDDWTMDEDDEGKIRSEIDM